MTAFSFLGELCLWTFLKQIKWSTWPHQFFHVFSHSLRLCLLLYLPKQQYVNRRCVHLQLNQRPSQPHAPALTPLTLSGSTPAIQVQHINATIQNILLPQKYRHIKSKSTMFALTTRVFLAFPGVPVNLVQPQLSHFMKQLFGSPVNLGQVPNPLFQHHTSPLALRPAARLSAGANILHWHSNYIAWPATSGACFVLLSCSITFVL